MSRTIVTCRTIQLPSPAIWLMSVIPAPRIERAAGVSCEHQDIAHPVQAPCPLACFAVSPVVHVVSCRCQGSRQGEALFQIRAGALYHE